MSNRYLILKKTCIVLIYLLIVILMMYNFPYDNQYQNEYIFLFLIFLFMGSLLMLILMKFNVFIFEPIILLSVVYFSIFIFRPMIDIINNEIPLEGVNVIDGCVKTTLIFVVSYLFFIFGYFIRNNNGNSKEKTLNVNLDTDINKERIVKISLVLWSISFIISLMYLIKTGKSIAYIFSFGNQGNMEKVESNIDFIGNISFSMIIPWLYIFINSNKKILKLVCTWLTITIFLATGFRFPLVIIILSPIVYYYCKKRKNPSIMVMFTVLMGLLLMAGSVGFMRVGVRHGTGVNWSEFNIEDIMGVFDSDLTIYKPFYAIVQNYPKNYPYYYGYEMILATLTMFIPRAIWPNKPVTISKEVITNTINLRASLNAQAYPSLASVYLEFGLIGCVLVMFITGVVFRKLKQMYLEGDIFSITIYSAILPAIFQLLIRNHIPSLVYFMIFLLTPNILIKRYSK